MLLPTCVLYSEVCQLQNCSCLLHYAYSCFWSSMDNVVPCDPYIVFEAYVVVSYIFWPPKDKFALLHGIEDGFHRDKAHKEGYRYCSIH